MTNWALWALAVAVWAPAIMRSTPSRDLKTINSLDHRRIHRVRNDGRHRCQLLQDSCCGNWTQDLLNWITKLHVSWVVIENRTTDNPPTIGVSLQICSRSRCSLVAWRPWLGLIPLFKEKQRRRSTTPFAFSWTTIPWNAWRHWPRIPRKLL